MPRRVERSRDPHRNSVWRLGIVVVLPAFLFLADAAHAMQEDQDQQNRAEQIGEAAGQIAVTPLSDLNLHGGDVPQILEDIQDPYAPPRRRNCSVLAQEVSDLTAVLGPDVDEEPAEENDDETTEAIGSAVSSAIIPFRGLVRRLSGAQARDRRIRELYLRGVTRRAYLKGMGRVLGCRPPAAPQVQGP